ncbi:MAG: hypothetical protein ACO4AI_05480 [Prochlorothrix sp.]|nr:hypothetical protein [Prochlorothrix sp.]
MEIFLYEARRSGGKGSYGTAAIGGRGTAMKCDRGLGRCQPAEDGFGANPPGWQ